MAVSVAGSEAGHLLRVAAVWGTRVVGCQFMEVGQDCVLGDRPGTLSAIPDGVSAPSIPLRASAGGWELDASGALGGVLMLRGREEDVAGLVHSGARMPIVQGDHGLIQYGVFALFFQYTGHPPPIAPKAGFLRSVFAVLATWLGDDPLVPLSLLSSLIVHLGLIGLLIVNWTPPDYQLPPELVSPEDYAERFGLKRILPDMAPAAISNDAAGGSQKAKNQGVHDSRKQGGGEKMAGKEGKGGLAGKDDRNELPGETKPTMSYGGLSEALADTGSEIKKTLSQIQTVAEALGGLNSNSVVLGSGSASGLRGSGAGGGGVGAGVMFGSGALNTGWGPGVTGGFGAGVGGEGGHGAGGAGAGRGAGGDGRNGAGPGERGLQAAAGAGAVHGGLNAEQIRRVVMAHRGALQACYEIEAQKDPTLRGGVTATWSIDPSGAVTGANIGGTTIHNSRIEGCILRQVRAWHFPSSDGSSQATFPFSFGIGR